MPYKLKTPCKMSSCPNLCEPGHSYCAEHESMNRKHQDDNRLPSHERGYDGTWKRARKMYLARHPLCEICGKPAVLVHHVQRIVEGGERLDTDNLQALCRQCHDEQHKKHGWKQAW